MQTKRMIWIVAVLMFITTNLYAQVDTAKFFRQVGKFVTLIKSKDTAQLSKVTTDSLYCSMCSKTLDHSAGNYYVPKKVFFQQHFAEIFNADLLKRMNRNERILFSEKSKYADYIVWYTIFRKDEQENGHEGGQFGLWFKKTKKGLQLSGVETIP